MFGQVRCTCGKPIEWAGVTAPTSTPTTPAAQSGTQVLGIIAVVVGVAATLMPYFAAVFLVPVAAVMGILAYTRGQKGLGIAAIVLAGIGLIGIFAVSNQMTDALNELQSLTF